MSLIPGWRSVTKRTLDLFGRWGESRVNVRSMLDGVIPTVVVDRFRDDDEGSVFGINAFSLGAANHHPTVSFGSSVNDWEVLAITQLGRNYNLKPSTFQYELMLFTPIFPFNPATIINPVGVFPSGLLTNRSFTFGTVQAIGGAVAAPPPLFGPGLAGPTSVAVTSSAPLTFASNVLPWPPFDTPLRIYRDVTLTFMLVLNPVAPTGIFPVELSVSLLCRERPKVSA